MAAHLFLWCLRFLKSRDTALPVIHCMCHNWINPERENEINPWVRFTVKVLTKYKTELFEDYTAPIDPPYWLHPMPNWTAAADLPFHNEFKSRNFFLSLRRNHLSPHAGQCHPWVQWLLELLHTVTGMMVITMLMTMLVMMTTTLVQKIGVREGARWQIRQPSSWLPLSYLFYHHHHHSAHGDSNGVIANFSNISTHK